MLGVDLLYKPAGRSVLDLRSNLANDLRQRAIAKNLDQRRMERSRASSQRAASSIAGWNATSASELRSALPRERAHSSIDESVYRAKNALASVRVPEVDVEDARRDYIRKVGRDYSAVGLTSYIIAQRDAKEFRERCYFVLSRRPKAAAPDGACDDSDSPFFNNRKALPGRPRTPDEVLLGSIGRCEPLGGFDAAGGARYSPARSYRAEREAVTSPFAHRSRIHERAASSRIPDYAHSMMSEEPDLEQEHVFRIGRMSPPEEMEAREPPPKRSLGRSTQRVDVAVTMSPELTSVESQTNRRQVVEELLEEHKDLIPEDLDVQTLGYAEKRKLLKQLGFGDDYIANRLCDRYTASQKRRNTKLTPLTAFSMYDRQDLNESMQVHKDLSVEFSRYAKGTEPPTATTQPSKNSNDVYKSLKAMLES